MHDFFDVIGLPRNAPLGEIRRFARRLRRQHPDFRLTPDGHRLLDSAATGCVPRDVAVDFVDVSTVIDRIESAFFGSAR